MSTRPLACGSLSLGLRTILKFSPTVYNYNYNHTSQLNSKDSPNKKRLTRRTSMHVSSRDITRYAKILNSGLKTRTFLRCVYADEGNSLLCPSRKCLVCVPEVEVHTLAQGLLCPGRAQSEYEATVYQVFPYVLNTEGVAFIALRYLARALYAPHANVFAYTYYAHRFTALLVEYIDAALELQRPEGTLEWEWENLDALVAQVFAEDYWYFGSATRPELVDWIWSKIVERVLRLAEYFPETVAQLAKQTDVQQNLASGNLRALAIYPTLVLRSAEAAHDAGDFDVCASVDRPPASFGPRRPRHPAHKPEGDGYQEIDSVADAALLALYSRRLASFSASDDEKTAAHAIHHIKIIASLDRYCFASISDAVANTSLISERHEAIARHLRNAAAEHRRQRSRERPTTRTMGVPAPRRRDDGAMHVRHGPAFSRRHPCDTCAARGAWAQWLASSTASCEALVASDDQLLWLYVTPAAPLRRTRARRRWPRPRPRGRRRARRAGVHREPRRAARRVRRARVLAHDALHGGAAPDDDGSAGGVDADPEDVSLGLGRGFAEPPLFTPGVDATGPVYWREVWIDDDEDSIGSESTDAEFWCSDDTVDFNFKLG
ncbi:hypothetical protein EW145_g7603 [Phellinidium pouzarii]|uniref:Uncharacterized protein n=1 Tax=Phellinidium pouzarii TaxID=167371 RepID=A0A4S4KHZ7_9AGAM|nr:hypothetical protein EW145_g7603 [Phellinidium pouzarii]